jgi:hypothetical protein
MPAKERPGMIGKYVELTEEQAERLLSFARGRGESFAHHVRLAIDRHLAYPPPVEKAVAPPPPVPLPDHKPRRRPR